MDSVSRQQRVRSRADFARARTAGKIWRGNNLRIVVVANTFGFTRLGLSVPRKAGSAVKRNRIRRWAREGFRAELANLQSGTDLIVSPRFDAVPNNYQEVVDDLTALRAFLEKN